MRRYLPFLILAAVALGAATGGTMIYRAKHARIATLAARTAADNAGGKPGAVPAHAHGPDDAVVTLEEYGDFQCPPCATLAELLRTLERDFKGRLRVVFRQYPLEMHKHARLAALGAEAAALQGRFWEMHELLYKKREEWANAPDFRPFLDTYAKTIGLNMERFAKDLESTTTQTRLKLDRERATSLGVNATPTVFINGRVVGAAARTPEALRAAIQEAIDGKKAP